MKLTRVLSTVLVVVFLTATTTPVGADAPDKYTFPYASYEELDCGDYIVRYEFQGTVTVIDHLEQGFANVHNSFQDAFYRTDGVGEVYTHVEQNSSRWTEQGEELHGITWHMVIPGHGSIFIVAGHLLLDWETGEAIFVHGNSNKNYLVHDGICAAFAE